MTTADPDATPKRQGWRHQARAIVSERLGLKATALLVSMLLWFVVRVVRGIGSAP
jgi:hypothetical protein